MNCDIYAEQLTETARREQYPGAALKQHLRACQVCAERWDSERDLTAELRLLRAQTSGQRSTAAARAALMARYDARLARTPAARWYWGLAAAAALLLAILAGMPDVNRNRPAPFAQEAAAQTDPESDGFIAVPYAPPLAAGEFVRIVHTELDPAALASLGVNVDPSWNTQLPADVMEGEDGMPRAVRVSDTDSTEGGF
jgi:hypothetical protein